MPVQRYSATFLARSDEEADAFFARMPCGAVVRVVNQDRRHTIRLALILAGILVLWVGGALCTERLWSWLPMAGLLAGK